MDESLRPVENVILFQMINDCVADTTNSNALQMTNYDWQLTNGWVASAPNYILKSPKSTHLVGCATLEMAN